MLNALLAGIGLMIAASLCYLFYRRNLAKKIIEKGIRVKGVMVQAGEKPGNYKNTIAGRVYLPVVAFFTTEGQPITGSPILGFKTSDNITTPVEVIVIYDPAIPERFCVERK